MRVRLRRDRVAGAGSSRSQAQASGATSTASVSVSPTTGPSGPGIDLQIAELTGTGVVVHNVGTEAAGRFVVSVQDQAFIVVDGLEAGKSATFAFRCRTGPLTAIADATERVDESDESNNGLTAGPFACETTTTSSTATTTTKPPQLPDLVVRSVGQDSVTVANDGRGRAGPFFGDRGQGGDLQARGSGARHEPHVRVRVRERRPDRQGDPSNAVEESDESNNTRSGGPFPKCLPDLVVSSIGATSVTIANTGNAPAGPSQISIAGQTFNVPAIDGGSKVAVDYGCIGGVIDVVADVQQQVDESNESNNTGSGNVGQC